MKMFDYLLKENSLSDEFKPKDLEFVKELILCPKNKVATLLLAIAS